MDFQGNSSEPCHESVIAEAVDVACGVLAFDPIDVLRSDARVISQVTDGCRRTAGREAALLFPGLSPDLPSGIPERPLPPLAQHPPPCT